MCLILDSNKFSDFANGKPDMLPVKKWIESGGRIAYAPTPKLKKEFTGEHTPQAFLQLFRDYRRAEKVKIVNEKEVSEEEKKLKKLPLKSNDSHIIALARIAKVKLLVSSDTDLHKDFTDNNIVGGKVYQTASHKHLLKEVDCP